MKKKELKVLVKDLQAQLWATPPVRRVADNERPGVWHVFKLTRHGVYWLAPDTETGVLASRWSPGYMDAWEFDEVEDAEYLAEVAATADAAEVASKVREQ